MPRGLDVPALTQWLDAQLPGVRSGPLRAELIAGGRSNLTYRVDDDTHHWVLRRPPLGHVLATAHDMGREYRVISALHGGPVPVPGPVVLCENESVLDAPFYLMERVDGLVLRSRQQLLDVPATDRGPLAERLVDTLAALHSIDPDAVGLADFGRPEGFMARQVARWGKQLEASRSRDVAGIDELHRALAARVPLAQRATVVHGDFRLDNVLVRRGTWDVAAVLDWEMATLGDPLTDVGLLLVYWGNEASATLGSITDMPAAVPGFPSGAELTQRYARSTGLDLAPLPWYVAFGCFKLAVILEGIHFRYTQGQTVGGGFDRIGAVVPGLVSAGLHAVKEAG